MGNGAACALFHRQLCADFLRDHRDGMGTQAVAKFAARIRMFDRVIASASLALSNLPDDNNDRHAMLRATIDSMAEDTGPISCRSPIRPANEAPQSSRPQDASVACYPVIRRIACAQPRAGRG